MFYLNSTSYLLDVILLKLALASFVIIVFLRYKFHQPCNNTGCAFQRRKYKRLFEYGVCIRVADTLFLFQINITVLNVVSDFKAS